MLRTVNRYQRVNQITINTYRSNTILKHKIKPKH